MLLSGLKMRLREPRKRRSSPGQRLRVLRRKPRRRPMTWESSRPRPLSRPKSLGYAGSTVPRFGMRPSNKLGSRLHPTCGGWRMCTTLLPSRRLPPPALRLGVFLRGLRLLGLWLLQFQLPLMSQPRRASPLGWQKQAKA